MRLTGLSKPDTLLGLLVAVSTFGCASKPTAAAVCTPFAAQTSHASHHILDAEAGHAAFVASPTDGEAETASDALDDECQAFSQQLEDDFVSRSPEAGVAVEHPLAERTADQLEQALLTDPEFLGSMSLGSPNAGLLFNGIQMPEGEHWRLMSPDCAWGTEETVGFIARCIDSVNDTFPETPPLPMGHISSRNGGPLSPHVSHQSGRDVDLGYYYVDGSPWYTRARESNLDRPRTWHLVRCLIVDTDIQMILIDSSLQRWLRAYARSIGEDPDWLDSVFEGVAGKLPPLIRHARGHATHIHVRFYNPIAQETARRVDSLLLKYDKISAPMRIVSYRAKKGDSLGKLARRFDTTVAAIQRANGLRSTLIRANVTYRIPCPAGGPVSSAPVRIPPRRLPPR